MSTVHLSGKEFNLSNKISREKYWNLKAKNILLNRKIVGVRYNTEEEQTEMMLNSRGLVIMLDNGTLLAPMSDDEGNDVGALHYIAHDNDWDCLPVM